MQSPYKNEKEGEKDQKNFHAQDEHAKIAESLRGDVMTENN